MVGAASWLTNETTVITKKNSNETQNRTVQYGTKWNSKSRFDELHMTASKYGSFRNQTLIDKGSENMFAELEVE